MSRPRAYWFETSDRSTKLWFPDEVSSWWPNEGLNWPKPMRNWFLPLVTSQSRTASSSRAPTLAPVTAGQLVCISKVRYGLIDPAFELELGAPDAERALAVARRSSVPGSVTVVVGHARACSASAGGSRSPGRRCRPGDARLAVAPFDASSWASWALDDLLDAVLEEIQLEGGLVVRVDGLPLGPTPRRVRPVPVSPEALKRSQFSFDVEDVDAAVLRLLRVEEALGPRTRGRAQYEEHGRRHAEGTPQSLSCCQRCLLVDAGTHCRPSHIGPER